MSSSRQNRLKIRRWIAARFPIIRRYWRLFKWRVIWPIRRMLTRAKSSISGLHVDPYQIYWMSPHAITYAIYRQIEGVPHTALVSGVIKGGTWDKNSLRVKDLEIIRSAKDRFVNGMEWEDTQYYRSHLEDISRGEQWRRCINKEDFDEYFLRFDRLYEQIRRNGYRSQSKILDPEFGYTAAPENEIAVHIDRDGHIIFCNGAHRLAIALALGIENIPVRVCIRHAKWKAFCNEILIYAEKNGGRVYQPLTHPDLQNIPSAHGEKRFEIISNHLPLNKGDLLDIGAHWGYFCHLFEELGFDCYAVESGSQNVYFLEKLRLAQDKNFKVIPQSIFTYREKTQFDVVLALNIFHHFLKRQDDYNALVSFLKRIDMNMMIFEPHHTSESPMIGAYRNYGPDEFVHFVLKHSRLNHSELIGKSEDKRPIYKLWR